MSKTTESGGLFFDGIVDGGDLSNPAVSRFVPFRQTLAPTIAPGHAWPDGLCDEEPEGGWTGWLSPAGWRAHLAKFGIPGPGVEFSDTRWRAYRKSHRFQEHPSSGNHLIRFAICDLKQEGVPAPAE